MTEWPKFCDAHKRWFTGDECDWCLHEIASRAEYEQWKARWENGFAYAVILTAHVDCGHLITDLVPLPNGEKMSILDLQMAAFAGEHKEILR